MTNFEQSLISFMREAGWQEWQEWQGNRNLLKDQWVRQKKARQRPRAMPKKPE